MEIVSTALWNGVGPQDTPPLSFLNLKEGDGIFLLKELIRNMNWLGFSSIWKLLLFLFKVSGREWVIAIRS